MTGPVTTEALVEGLRTDHLAAIDACLRASETNGEVSQGLRLREREADAALISTLLAAHQQVTAERDAARAEVERLRSVLDFEKRVSRVANAELARLRADVEAVLVEVTLMATLLLMAGEMTAPERRTARAVAEGIAAKIRTALARAATAREGA